MNEENIEDRCIWHKSSSIPKQNPAYKDCLTNCKGYNTRCIIYTPRGDYFRNLANYHSKKKKADEFIGDSELFEEEN